MNFLLTFETSGDIIPFKVKYNHDLLEYFIQKTQDVQQNSFFVNNKFSREIDSKISELHWAITKSNNILCDLIGKNISQQNDLINYLDQTVLNNAHSEWVSSQLEKVYIDKLRFNADKNKSKLGNFLHEIYPDEIRVIKLGEAMNKLGCIFPYEEINEGVHRLENCFYKIEFQANNKWEVFDNPYVHSMETNNDIINFSFGYTYVGRQYYNKFRFFDLNLD
jgi:hypothetical protein